MPQAQIARVDLPLDVVRKTSQTPFASFVYVDVTFDATNTDQIIEHTLATADPESIRWMAVTNDQGGIVYRDNSAGLRAFGEGYVVLRCTTASTVRLFLFLEQA